MPQGPERVALVRAYLQAVLAAAAAGAALVCVKAVDPALARPVLLSWLFLLAALALGAATLRRRGAAPRRWPKGTRRLLLLHVLFSAAAVASLYTGLLTLDAAVASFLGRTEVLFTVLLAVLVLRERFTRGEALGAGIAVLGLLVVHQAALAETGKVPEGFWITVFGMGLMGGAEIFNKRLVPRLHPETLAFARAGGLGALFAVVALARGDGLAPPAMADFLRIAGAALLAPVLARTLYIRSLGVLDLSKAAVMMLLQPLFAAGIAWTFLGTSPTSFEWLGGLVLLVGCAVLVRARVRAAR